MTIEVFKDKEKLLRGHVDFIYAALKNMEEYGVHKDIEVSYCYLYFVNDYNNYEVVLLIKFYI